MTEALWNLHGHNIPRTLSAMRPSDKAPRKQLFASVEVTVPFRLRYPYARRNGSCTGENRHGHRFFPNESTRNTRQRYGRWSEPY